MKRYLTLLATALLVMGSAVLFSARANAQDTPINWSSSIKVADDGKSFDLIITGACQTDWHTYALEDSLNPLELEISSATNCQPSGRPYTITEPTPITDDTGARLILNETFSFGQKFTVNDSSSWGFDASLQFVSCIHGKCDLPEYWEFTYLNDSGAISTVNKNVTTENEDVSQIDNQYISHQTEIKDPEEGLINTQSLWSLILEAILWGFVMILTPCVFPMIPMTVSYFLKNSSNPAAGRFNAMMYGVFIILLYTVPICIIIGATWLIGGDAVTADIFNWLSTHWIPNIIFFAVFLIFATSFFGAFEIVLPSSLVNKSGSKSHKKGLIGIFFMALTLVLVSFSCTGPIVGTVLIKSTQGEFWAPMLTMLAFSTAFALGFTFFAIFPTLLKNGPWMNSVKVVFGFIELAFALKFLSVADQTYHWHLLDREIYLAIWIVIFSLLGLYLLGKIRFKYDEKVEHIGLTRLGLSIATFSFVVYMIPGMWGAPLKGLSGFLPPIETQDFVLGGPGSYSNASSTSSNNYGLKLPLGLEGYFTLEEALEAAKTEGKPVFVDITGHGCVNCREMEQRVWRDEKVYNLLKDRFIIVALYTDDKSSLKEEDWITTRSGRVIKELGRANSYIAREKFGNVSQPNYTILDTNGNQLVPIRGYNLNVDSFVEYLQSGLDAFDGVDSDGKASL